MKERVILALVLAMGAAYFVFLVATWQQMQNDRAARDEKINSLLDRLPNVKPAE